MIVARERVYREIFAAVPAEGIVAAVLDVASRKGDER